MDLWLKFLKILNPPKVNFRLIDAKKFKCNLIVNLIHCIVNSFDVGKYRNVPYLISMMISFFEWHVPLIHSIDQKFQSNVYLIKRSENRLKDTSFLSSWQKYGNGPKGILQNLWIVPTEKPFHFEKLAIKINVLKRSKYRIFQIMHCWAKNLTGLPSSK